jgi:tetratricopeptide (TPR) repeat protein
MTKNSKLPNAAAAPFSTRQSAQALVSAAMAAHKSGNLDLVEQFLGQALEVDPKSHDAMQLMGMVARAKGNFPAAEIWMGNSLKQNDAQPHVHYNLGNLLRMRGAEEEALSHYEKATRQKRDYFEALIEQGDTLFALKRMAEAERILRQALALRPTDVSAVVAMANFLERTDRPEEGEMLLREGLRREPRNIFYLNNLGQTLCSLMRYDEAIALLAPIERDPLVAGRAEVHVNLANALLGAGRMEEAIVQYRRAIERDPLHYHAHGALNEVLWEIGRKDEVGESYAVADRLLPNNPDVMEMAAETYLALGRPADAERELLRAEELRPNTMGQYRLWTALRLTQGRPDLAVHLASAGLQKDPTSLDLLGKMAEAMFQLGEAERALLTARRMEEVDPVNQWAACYQNHALRLLGDEASAARIYDYDRFVQEVDLGVPEGYDTREAWLSSLKQALEELHLAQHEPLLQSLRNGTQTRHNLFGRPGLDPAIALLGERILAGVSSFLESLPDDPTHPFLRRKGRGLDWAGSWSVRLRGGGHHVDHIHDKGWISGAYYVDIPECVGNEEGKPGWIKFGEFSGKTGRTLPWQKAVQPRPGFAVFFPSYMTHGTLPTTGDETRLTVSFDIVPA